MPNPLNRPEDYRSLANLHRRLASNESCKETRRYHLFMARNFSTLAAAEEPATSTISNFHGSDLTDGVLRTLRFR